MRRELRVGVVGKDLCGLSAAKHVYKLVVVIFQSLQLREALFLLYVRQPTVRQLGKGLHNSRMPKVVVSFGRVSVWSCGYRAYKNSNYTKYYHEQNETLQLPSLPSCLGGAFNCAGMLHSGSNGRSPCHVCILLWPHVCHCCIVRQEKSATHLMHVRQSTRLCTTWGMYKREERERDLLHFVDYCSDCGKQTGKRSAL